MFLYYCREQVSERGSWWTISWFVEHSPEKDYQFSFWLIAKINFSDVRCFSCELELGHKRVCLIRTIMILSLVTALFYLEWNLFAMFSIYHWYNVYQSLDENGFLFFASSRQKRFMWLSFILYPDFSINFSNHMRSK